MQSPYRGPLCSQIHRWNVEHQSIGKMRVQVPPVGLSHKLAKVGQSKYCRPVAHVVDYNYSTLPLQQELTTGNMETNGCNCVPFSKKKKNFIGI